MPDIPGDITSTDAFQFAPGTNDGSFSGVLETPGDVDFVRLDLTVGHVTFYAHMDNAVGGGGDTAITLYDSAGNPVAFDDNSGAGANSLLGYDVATAGTYFLGVRSIANAPGTYSLATTTSNPVHVLGNDSQNTIDGAPGESLLGGRGNDTLNLNGALAAHGEQGNDTLNGGTIGETLWGGLGNDTLRGGDGVDNLFGDDGDDALGGGNGDDWLSGGNGDDRLFGDAGNDVLLGGDGNDDLTGGAGADTLLGGDGNDRYFAGSTDTISDSGGTDTVIASATFSLVGHGDIENLTLTGATSFDGTGNGLGNVIAGNTGNNTLEGLGGNDILTGGGGVDTLLGGFGDDTYVMGDDTDDSISDVSGNDTATSTVTRSLAAYVGVENLTLLGSANIDGTGNELNNVLIGNSGANVLTAASGNDTLIGGAGADTLNGGAGNDTYVLGGDPGDTIIDAAGNDTVTSTATRSLAGFMTVENLTLLGSANINGAGNGLGNTITGNSGANTLMGGDGNDGLLGQGGADVIWGGNGTDRLRGGGGDDHFKYNAVQESGPGSVADVIVDFQKNHDKIDLSAVDANDTVPDDQPFTFLGTGAFTGAAGELRTEQSGSETSVLGDVNGDGVADFQIQVTGLVNFADSDFIL